jgi:phage shock protein A
MSGTEERRVDQIEEAEREMDATADDLSERSDQLGEQIDSTKQTWEQAKADTSVPTASGDWEDTEPDDASGDDATGFDDPENLDLEDDDLDDTADEDDDD